MKPVAAISLSKPSFRISPGCSLLQISSRKVFLLKQSLFHAVKCNISTLLLPFVLLASKMHSEHLIKMDDLLLFQNEKGF